MSTRPSAALRALEQAVSVFDTDQPITWGQLQEKLAEAASAAEDREWQDDMGDDL